MLIVIHFNLSRSFFYGIVPKLFRSWHPFHKNKATPTPSRFEKSVEITKIARFCSISIY